MKIHELELTPTKDHRRAGRGISSGRGKTAGRGTKGQNARTGGGVRPGFEGGQNPLAKRLPKKRGFASLSRVNYQTVTTGQLEGISAKTIDARILVKAGIIKDSHSPIKLLTGAKVTKAYTVKVVTTSRAAREQVEAKGGRVELSPAPRPKKRSKTRS